MAGWVQKRFELALNGNVENEIVDWFNEQKALGYGSFPLMSQVVSRGHERWITITLNNSFAPAGAEIYVKRIQVYPKGLDEFVTWLNSYTTVAGTIINPVGYSLENGHCFMVGMVFNYTGVVSDGTWHAKLVEVGQNADGMDELATWLLGYDSGTGQYTFNTFSFETLNFIAALAV